MSIFTRACLVIALLTTPLTGCSKKGTEETVQKKSLSQSLLDEPLLQSLPDSTSGFMVMDLSGDGYTKFRSSPWGSDMLIMQTIASAGKDLELQGASPEQVQLIKTIIGSLQKLGLISADGRSQVEQVIGGSVAYIGVNKGKAIPFDAGLFLRAAAGANLTNLLPTLKQIITDAGFTVTDKQLSGAQGFLVSIGTSVDGATQAQLFVAATQTRLAISTSEEAATGLFSEKPTKTLATLKALPEFTKAEDAVRGTESPLSFAFLSVKALAPLFENDTVPMGNESINFKDNPVSAIAFSQGYSSQLVTSAGVAMSPVTDVQRNVLTALENTSLPASAFTLPSDTALSFSFDGRIIGKIASALKSLSEAAAEPALQQQLNNIQGITLGLRAGDGSSPIPDIYINIESSTRDQASSSIESGIALGLMATGQDLQWLSKEIAGNPSKYFMSPFGVGLYITSPKGSNSLIVANSERAIQDISSSATTKTASLATSMSKSLRERTTTTSIASVYLNSIQLANLIDAVKGTLASIMGPNPELDKALDSGRIRKFGVGLSNFSYANGVFKMQSALERSELP